MPYSSDSQNMGAGDGNEDDNMQLPDNLGIWSTASSE